MKRHVPRDQRANRIGLAVSIAVHCVAVSIGVIAYIQLRPAPDRRSSVSAEMVTLGTRPDAARVPAIATPTGVMRAQQPENALYDPTPDLPNETADRGSLLVPDPRMAEIHERRRDRYRSEIARLLHTNFFFPTGFVMDDIANPPEILLRLTDDGTIVDVTISQSSGDLRVDEACLNAARLTQQIPLPPTNVRPRHLRVSCEP